MMDFTTDPEVLRTLVLSTGHAEPSTIHKFKGDSFIGEYKFGVYFYVPDEGDVEIALPEDLHIVFDYARRLNCQEVKFDRDALFVPDLPRYEW